MLEKEEDFKESMTLLEERIALKGAKLMFLPRFHPELNPIECVYRFGFLSKRIMVNTGWSLKTVDCNFLLTDPKISKSAITQWFLESSFREVLVFWCFKTVRCVKICLLKLFQYRVFATQYKAWALPYTLIRIQTLNKSISSTQIPLEKLLRHPSDICRQHKTVKDVIRHQQTKIDVNINCHTSLNSLFGCLATSVGVVWCLLVSVVVLKCPEIPEGGVWEHLGKVYVCLWGLNASKGV